MCTVLRLVLSGGTNQVHSTEPTFTFSSTDWQCMHGTHKFLPRDEIACRLSVRP